MKYQDGVQISAFKPKYALNLNLDRSELKTYLGYLTLVCLSFAMLRYLTEDVEAFWLGFGIAFLNYSKLGRVFGIKTPDKTLIKARVVMEGSPEQLSRAFTDTHCELSEWATTTAAEQLTHQKANQGQRIYIQQFLLTLQSIDLSPFWLGLSSLVRKIAITNRALESLESSGKDP